MERRLKVYAPAPKLRERSLQGELEQLRSRLAELLSEIEGVVQASPQLDGWRDVTIATGIGLRALTAAVAAVPERSKLALATNTIVVGELRIDAAARRQWYRDREITLTPLHHQVLVTMAAEPQRLFRNEELSRLVWGKDGLSHAVNHAVCRVRDALAAAGADRDAFLIAVHHQGWRLIDAAANVEEADRDG